jgi:hypothetical protein
VAAGASAFTRNAVSGASITARPRRIASGPTDRAHAALGQITEAGGGLVEAISEVTSGRTAHGRFLYSATVELFEEFGFTRVRQAGKHAWIVSCRLQ